MNMAGYAHALARLSEGRVAGVGVSWRGRERERERERERDADGSHLKPRSEKYRSDTWPANRNSVKKTRLSLRFCLFPLWILASLEERDVEDSEEEEEKIEKK